MIRFADMYDVPILLDAARKSHLASPYSALPYDEEKVRLLLLDYMTAPRSEKILLISFRGDDLVGFIAGQVSEMLFASMKIASEVMWWVEPQFRQSVSAIRLQKAFTYWAKKMAPVATMAAMETEDAETVKRFYTKDGYVLTESTYIKVF